MGIINLVYNISLYNIFVLFSWELYFNEKIEYSEVKKNWIIIKNNKLVWNHKFAELKHVLDNIYLKKNHRDAPPNMYYNSELLSKLNYNNCTKYEKFTSLIVNKMLKQNKKIQEIRIIHCKNIRKKSKLDIPLMCLQLINKTEPQEIYKLSESTKLMNTIDLMNILLNSNKNTLVICFTDWRDLYRKGYSLSHAKFLFLNVKNIMNKLNIIINAVTMNVDTMYAIDILNQQ